MNNYGTKLKHLLPIYLIIVIGTVLGFGLFRWIFAIKWQIVDLKLEMWELWIPAIFPWIPISIWLRPRLRILKFKDPERGMRFFQVITWIALFAMLSNLQISISRCTGDLITVENIKTFKASKKADYFVLQSFAVDTNYRGTHYSFRESNKGRDLNFNAYTVLPILTDTSEAIIESPRLWVGFINHKQISNRLSTAEKEAIFKQFRKESREIVNGYNIRSINYFMNVPNSTNRDYYFKAIEDRNREPADDRYTVLEPQTESYKTKTKPDLTWFYIFSTIGPVAFCLLLLWPGFNKTEYAFQLAGKKRKNDDLRDIMEYVIPKGDHFMTSILIDISIVLFLLMLFTGSDILSPTASQLLEWGGNSRMETTNGEWWRLVTSIFIHDGIIHLAVNTFGLIIASKYVEPIFGRKKLLLFYLSFGILANFLSICWYKNDYSVGSSGAVFGLYGAIFILLLFTDTYQNINKNRLYFSILYIGIYFIFGCMGRVDNMVQISGFIFGSLIAFLNFKLKDGWQEVI